MFFISSNQLNLTKLWGSGKNLGTIILSLDALFFAILWISGFGETPDITTKGLVSVAGSVLCWYSSKK